MTEPIHFYSMPTPNGQKVGIALEEMEIPYLPHVVNIMKGDQFEPDYVQINPNSKIPSIVDPVGDNGQPLSIMESGAILIYLAEKSGRFLPEDPAERNRVLQWLFFQVGSVGPMFGQFGHFYKFAGDACDHPYPLARYQKEVSRLLQVMENRLEASHFIAGNELSIADFATVPWVAVLDGFYAAGDVLQLEQYPAVQNWVKACLDRPKTRVGLEVCKPEGM